MHIKTTAGAYVKVRRSHFHVPPRTHPSHPAHTLFAYFTPPCNDPAPHPILSTSFRSLFTVTGGAQSRALVRYWGAKRPLSSWMWQAYMTTFLVRISACLPLREGHTGAGRIMGMCFWGIVNVE